MQEYKKHLYRIGTSGQLETREVASAEEERQLGKGWYPHPDEARAAKEGGKARKSDDDDQAPVTTR